MTGVDNVLPLTNLGKFSSSYDNNGDISQIACFSYWLNINTGLNNKGTGVPFSPSTILPPDLNYTMKDEQLLVYHVQPDHCFSMEKIHPHESLAIRQICPH
ncbi:hypothetical protein BLA29_013323 [Euroglyphus maynei]|uniref:Uncharacterized protein n=1 Tax=Euroglyphus maynei TaxID=6958 RepID=A0A1Y3ANX5_EURMA|nr:hypothetical protein BLA29_013323 [Euroglyphus maynei]